MIIKRLPYGPLPDDFAAELRDLSVNAVTGNLESGERLEIEGPFTGDIIGWVGRGTEEDVAVAFERARAAQKIWAKTSHKERGKILLRYHDLVLKHRELLMDMVQLETGKSRDSAFEEVLHIAITARYYGNHIGKILKPKHHTGVIPFLTKSTEFHVPKGVIGQIAPWNYPLTLGISDSLPGIAAGNALVAKPDSDTPFTSLLAFSLLFEAGMPRNVVQLVTGPGRVVGNAIAESCDYLMFTGSTATGKRLGEIAGRRLIGFSAELGGKNPLIVTENAKVDKIVDGVVTGCFANSGQLCVSIERIYAHENVYDEFVTAFAKATSDMTLGAGYDWKYTMGSLAGAAQLATVEKYVDDAKDKGAKVVAGGKARPDLGPYFYEPTVFTDVSDDVLLKREEVFGPVVYIEKVSSHAEAVEKANDTDYGLNSSVWGPSKEANEVAAQLYSGTVNVNDGYAAAFASVDNEMGGTKESGQGRRQGHYGMLKYTETQNITEQRLLPLRGPKFLTARPYAAIMTVLLSVGKKLKILR
ncbi:succinic semialdehyde dehydrogenase [Corynebacterium terpenotabidum]|uniref:Succinic semialdehyde dehydrogenase n=1 Tax=Corynebacterium terpenotabidum Y-11 TaxID=1200352 RepID=S4XKV9_9CORY|nr:succinic semialdehyde dehydrogenase [Corynebacterium terpenotabidum]AGP31228.1 succinic semialdehyde dehydrogenase [Corynebacterium terpenotabidum Y-11]